MSGLVFNTVCELPSDNKYSDKKDGKSTELCN